MAISPDRLRELAAVYRDGLLDDTLPFWLPRSVDEEYGGYLLIRDRDGSLMDTDKAMWHQGRFAWLLAELYRTVEPRGEWLAWARHGIEFIRAHGFDADGRMFFHVTRDGRPVRKRRYIFSETFAIAALGAYAAAARETDPEGAARAAGEAEELFARVERTLADPAAIPPKFDPTVRPAKGLAVPMIMIVTAQIVRRVAADPAVYTERIDRAIAEIERDFVHPERRVVMETVAPDGSVIDHMDWRTITPGHSIEAAWFILQEASDRGNDPRLVELGTRILDWMWEWAWDTEYGGILYFRDVTGRPVQEYWHDMKFWWPHCEAIIASLMAYRLTGRERYAQMHEQVHEWAYAHFPDPEHGEWYGYLHRDGRISVPLKGNLWKGPFHLPRMQLVAWREVEALLAGM
ncbi:MAG: AGE family epimerase/isomerase [Spirochaetota bacterium]